MKVLKKREINNFIRGALFNKYEGTQKERKIILLGEHFLINMKVLKKREINNFIRGTLFNKYEGTQKERDK